MLFSGTLRLRSWRIRTFGEKPKQRFAVSTTCCMLRDFHGKTSRRNRHRFVTRKWVRSPVVFRKPMKLPFSQLKVSFAAHKLDEKGILSRLGPNPDGVFVGHAVTCLEDNSCCARD